MSATIALSEEEHSSYTVVVESGVLKGLYYNPTEITTFLDINNIGTREEQILQVTKDLESYSKNLDPITVLRKATIQFNTLSDTNVLKMFINRLLDLPSGLTERNSERKLIVISIIGTLIRLELDPGNEIAIMYRNGQFLVHSIANQSPVTETNNRTVEAALKTDTTLRHIISFLLVQLSNTILYIQI